MDGDAEEPIGWAAGKSAAVAGSTVVLSGFVHACVAGAPNTVAGKSAAGTGCPIAPGDLRSEVRCQCLPLPFLRRVAALGLVMWRHSFAECPFLPQLLQAWARSGR